jgi:hypothetical protein
MAVPSIRLVFAGLLLGTFAGVQAAVLASNPTIHSSSGRPMTDSTSYERADDQLGYGANDDLG